MAQEPSINSLDSGLPAESAEACAALAAAQAHWQAHALRKARASKAAATLWVALALSLVIHGSVIWACVLISLAHADGDLAGGAKAGDGNGAGGKVTVKWVSRTELPGAAAKARRPEAQANSLATTLAPVNRNESVPSKNHEGEFRRMEKTETLAGPAFTAGAASLHPAAAAIELPNVEALRKVPALIHSAATDLLEACRKLRAAAAPALVRAWTTPQSAGVAAMANIPAGAIPLPANGAKAVGTPASSEISRSPPGNVDPAGSDNPSNVGTSATGGGPGENSGQPGSGGSRSGLSGSGGSVLAQPARLLSKTVTPQYPERSRDNDESGTVVLKLEILADGSVGQIVVLEDPGYPRLVGAAIEAVRHWNFAPATASDGRAVRSWVTAPIPFELRRP